MRATPIRRPLFLLATVMALVLSGLGLAPSQADDDAPFTSVTASLRDPGGSSVEGVPVRLLRWDGGGWQDVEERAIEDGSARFDVVPGAYVFEFGAPTPEHVTVRGNGVDPEPQVPGDPGTFEITETTVDFEYEAATRERWIADSPAIRGVVQDPDGLNPDDVLVVAYPAAGGAPVASAWTYGSARPDGPQHGYFELFVPAGTYTLAFSDPDGDRYEPAVVDAVEVGSEPLYLGTIDVSPRNDIERASVTGRVVDAAGEPLTDVSVVLYRFHRRSETYSPSAATSSARATRTPTSSATWSQGRSTRSAPPPASA